MGFLNIFKKKVEPEVIQVIPERVPVDWSVRYSDYQCDTRGWASTGYMKSGPLWTSYTEKEAEPERCEYCGNYSKLRNPHGNCIACGAPRKP